MGGGGGRRCRPGESRDLARDRAADERCKRAMLSRAACSGPRHSPLDGCAGTILPPSFAAEVERVGYETELDSTVLDERGRETMTKGLRCVQLVYSRQTPTRQRKAAWATGVKGAITAVQRNKGSVSHAASSYRKPQDTHQLSTWPPAVTHRDGSPVCCCPHSFCTAVARSIESVRGRGRWEKPNWLELIRHDSRPPRFSPFSAARSPICDAQCVQQESRRLVSKVQ